MHDRFRRCELPVVLQCILDVESQLEGTCVSSLTFWDPRHAFLRSRKQFFVIGKAIVPKTELLK